MKYEKIKFVVGKYTIHRDDYGNWYRDRLEDEQSVPSGSKVFGLSAFEQTLAEALISNTKEST